MKVANEILRQLGGNKFIAMTGAKDLVGGKNYLGMKLGRGTKNKATHMRITLDPTDTYTVEFMRWNGRKLEMKVLSSESLIYCDMLQETFTEATGFDTHL